MKRQVTPSKSPLLTMEPGQQRNNHSTGTGFPLNSFQGPQEHRGADFDRGNQGKLQGGGDLWVYTWSMTRSLLGDLGGFFRQKNSIEILEPVIVLTRWFFLFSFLLV